MIYKVETYIDDDNRPQWLVISGRSEMEVQEKSVYGQTDRLPSFENKNDAEKWGREWEEMEYRLRE